MLVADFVGAGLTLTNGKNDLRGGRNAENALALRCSLLWPRSACAASRRLRVEDGAKIGAVG